LYPVGHERFFGESSVTGESSFLARFTLKFFEVLFAGFATAVSGFLVAHFTGLFGAPAPAPAVMQPAALQAPAATSPATSRDTVQVQPQRPAAIDSATTAITAAPPESKPVTAAAVETKPRDTDVKTLSADKKSADKKSDTAPSLEARVRAALAKANRPAPAEAPRREMERSVSGKPQAPTAATQPRGEAFITNTTAPHAAATAPRAVDSAPQPAAMPATPTTGPQRAEAAVQPAPPPAAAIPLAPQAPAMPLAPQAPAMPLAPPTTVEITSQPVAGMNASPATAQADASNANQERDDGPLSSITKFLRSDKPLPEDQALRPPAPVGQ
jgi:hypothetical protein